MYLCTSIHEHACACAHEASKGYWILWRWNGKCLWASQCGYRDQNSGPHDGAAHTSQLGLTLPEYVLPNLTKVASWLNLLFSHMQNSFLTYKKTKKKQTQNPFALVVCFERQIRTCKDYTWSGAWHTINTLIFLNCDRRHWDFTLGGGVHKVWAQLDSNLSLWLSLWVSYGLRS